MSFLSSIGNAFKSVASVATGFLGAASPLGAGLSILMGGLGKGGFDLGSLISPLTKGLSDVLGGLFGPKMDQAQNQFANFQNVINQQFPRLPVPPPQPPSLEDRLVAATNRQEDKLDSLISQLENTDDPKKAAALQAKIQQVSRMLELISDVMKKINEVEQNTISNIRG